MTLELDSEELRLAASERCGTIWNYFTHKSKVFVHNHAFAIINLTSIVDRNWLKESRCAALGIDYDYVNSYH